MVKVRQAGAHQVSPGALKVKYEPEVDILMIYLQEPETPLSYGSEASPGIVLNYAPDGSLASVEIMDASERYPPEQLAAHSVDELIDLRTASELIGIAPVTLRAQAEKGRLRAMKLGGRWLTTRERLQQYLDSRAKNAKVINS